MRSFVIIPVLMVGMVLQTAVFGNFSLVAGKVDILLLILVSWNIHKDDLANYLWAIFAGLLFVIYSSTPVLLPIFAYILVTFLTRKIKSMTYHMPIFLLILSTLVGSIVFYGLFLAQIWVFSGFQVDINAMFWSIAVPSLFLDLVLVLPANSVVKEFVKISDPNVEIL